MSCRVNIYVLVPADKAANNVIVVCKKYYMKEIAETIILYSTYEQITTKA